MNIHKYIKNKLSDESTTLTEKLLTIILNCIILGSLVGFLPMLLGNTKGWWLNILIMLLAVIAQIINITFKKREAATLFLSFTGVMIVMPLMYFFQGGYASGMPFWLVFAILTAFIMNHGWKRYVTVAIALIIFAGCIFTEYLHPDAVDHLPTRASIYTDILISFISTTLIFLLMLDMYLKAYKKKRDSLDYALHYDALTGIENRYAYEKYLKAISQQPFSNKLIFVSADVNSLKKVNDTQGHMAGDELLIGAAKVFSQTFNEYGKVFRTGGDEFQAIINTERELKEIQEAFNTNMNSWTGKLVKDLHISIGYACSKDSLNTDYTELSKTADFAMYKDKASYYERIGINRRREY